MNSPIVKPANGHEQITIIGAVKNEFALKIAISIGNTRVLRKDVLDDLAIVV
jgi:hypothetical protein